MHLSIFTLIDLFSALPFLLQMNLNRCILGNEILTCEYILEFGLPLTAHTLQLLQVTFFHHHSGAVQKVSQFFILYGNCQLKEFSRYIDLIARIRNLHCIGCRRILDRQMVVASLFHIALLNLGG